MLTLLCMWMTKTTAAVNYQLALCNQNIEGVYTIDSPPSCKEITQSNTKSLEISVVYPQPMAFNVEATACAVREQVSRYWWNTVWGSVKRTIIDQKVPARPDQCEKWKQTLRDPKMGRLEATNGNDQFYTTRNPEIPDYHWPWGKTVKTYNGELTKTRLSFSSITGKGKHFYEYLKNCDASTGICYSTHRVYIFTPFEVKCGYTGKRPKRNLQMQVHTSENGQYYLIKDENLAFTQLLQCPKRINDCHRNTLFVRCTATHFVILSNDTETLGKYQGSNKNTSETHKQSKEEMGISPSVEIISQEFQSLAIKLDAEITALRDNILSLQCLNTRAILTNLQSSAIIAPSQTLSLLLQRQVKAVRGISTLQELHCETVRAVLETSLWYEGRYLSTPIFHVIYGGSSYTAQWMSDGYLRKGVRDFSQPDGGRAIFQLGSEFVEFHNGTLLLGNTTEIKTLHLPGGNKNLPIDHTYVDTWQLGNDLENLTEVWSLDGLHRSLQTLIELTAERFGVEGIEKGETARILTGSETHPVIKSYFQRMVEKVTPSKLVLFAKTAAIICFGVLTAIILLNVIAGLRKAYDNVKQRPRVIHDSAV